MASEGEYSKSSRLNLLPNEVFWRDRQVFLQKRGYMLRPRYRPGWIPSWIASGQRAGVCEDGQLGKITMGVVIDAVRISDDKRVSIKKMFTMSNEGAISTMLSTESLRQYPRNHCVPVDQLLEGLVFIHEHRVAHRDCADRNIMMDSSGLYPNGFHPLYPNWLPDLSAHSTVLTRSQVSPPVKYYYIDFGLSSYHPDESQPVRVTGNPCMDKEPPELQFDDPYDPFKLDIFIIGNLLRREIYGQYSNLGFLPRLFECMIRKDPATRPTAVRALA